MNFWLLLVCFINMPVHDIQVAYFKVYQENNFVYVDFTIEKEDIEALLKKDSVKERNELIQNYLNEHFKLSIDSQVYPLSYRPFLIKDKHLRLQGKTIQQLQSIQTIEINNTCLLNIEDHSNIIQIRIHDQERDFLMNTDRTHIKINF